MNPYDDYFEKKYRNYFERHQRRLRQQAFTDHALRLLGFALIGLVVIMVLVWR